MKLWREKHPEPRLTKDRLISWEDEAVSSFQFDAVGFRAVQLLTRTYSAKVARPPCGMWVQRKFRSGHSLASALPAV